MYTVGEGIYPTVLDCPGWDVKRTCYLGEVNVMTSCELLYQLHIF